MTHLHSTGSDGGRDLLPGVLQKRETLPARRAQPVIAPRATADLLLALQQHALRHQTVQHRVDAAFAELERALRSALNLGHKLITIHFLVREQPEDQQFGHAIE